MRAVGSRDRSTIICLLGGNEAHALGRRYQLASPFFHRAGANRPYFRRTGLCSPAMYNRTRWFIRPHPLRAPASAPPPTARRAALPACSNARLLDSAVDDRQPRLRTLEHLHPTAKPRPMP